MGRAHEKAQSGFEVEVVKGGCRGRPYGSQGMRMIARW